MIDRLLELPGSFRFITGIVMIAVTYLNDRYLHLTPEQLQWTLAVLGTLIVSDTFRRIGKGDGVSLGEILRAIIEAARGKQEPKQ